jgi:catechol 2,3-dioxygenase-like lactoylglutathione lyase family enzyme
MSEQPEFYPMPSFPALVVGDVAASSRWYQEALGFAHVFTMPGAGGAPGLAHLRWAKYADLLLRGGPPADGRKGVGITLNFALLGGSIEALDALAERARSHGAVFVQEPGDRPWNARDFTVADPDSFALTFTFGPLNAGMTMDALTAKSSKS